MASVSSPYGFQPVADQGGPAPRPLRIPFGIASGYNANIFKGQPVFINTTTGTLNGVTTTTQAIFGIFQGIEYTPLGGRPAVSPFWAAGTIYDPTYDTFAYVYPGWQDSVRFRVQAAGSILQPGLGDSYNIANPTAGNTALGLSQCGILPTTAGAGNLGQFFLVEFDTGINSAIGDAFTDVIVGIARAQVGAGFTSIG